LDYRYPKIFYFASKSFALKSVLRPPIENQSLANQQPPSFDVCFRNDSSFDVFHDDAV